MLLGDHTIEIIVAEVQAHQILECTELIWHRSAEMVMMEIKNA
jgi:hypothetical protein